MDLAGGAGERLRVRNEEGDEAVLGHDRGLFHRRQVAARRQRPGRIVGGKPRVPRRERTKMPRPRAVLAGRGVVDGWRRQVQVELDARSRACQRQIDDRPVLGEPRQRGAVVGDHRSQPERQA